MKSARPSAARSGLAPWGGRSLLSLSSRSPSAATARQLRVGISLCCIAGAVSILADASVAWFLPDLAYTQVQRDPVTRAGNLGFALAILLFGLVVRRWPTRWEWLLGVPFAIAALVTCTSINLLNGTGNAGAQVAGALPAILITFYLTWPSALLVGVLTVISQQVIVWSTLPTAAALNDTIYVPIFLLLLTGLLALARHEQDRVNAELRLQAQRDPVTRLATRQLLDAAIANALARQPERSRVCLVMVDLDNFKGVNDTYGHPIGDRTLAQVSACLRRLAGPGDLAARVGGDELALLLHDATPKQALALAERLAEDVRAIGIRVGEDEVRVSISAGVGYLTDPDADVEALYNAADQELYRAKRAGRNRVSAQTITLPDVLPGPRTPGR